MATVHFSDSFESNDFSNWSRTLDVGGGNSIFTSTLYAKAGTYGVKVDLEDTVSGDKARLEKDDCMSVGSGGTIFASGWFFFPTGFNVVDTVYLFNIFEGSDAYKNILVGLNSSEQLWVNNQAATENYTQASPIAVPTNQWCGIEIEVYVHNTEGYIKLRQDGVVIINATGKDTLSTGTWKDVLFGATYIEGVQTCIFYFDEVYVQDEQKIGTPTVDQTSARIKGIIQQSHSEAALRIKGKVGIGVDQSPIRIKGKIHGIISTARIKGIIQRDLDAIVTRIKGVIQHDYDATPTRIKGVIQHDYDGSVIRIKGTIWRLIHETFHSDIRALTADADQTSLRIKGKISLPVAEIFLHTDIRGQTGIIETYLRIKGAISNSAAQTPVRIKGIISGPHTETALRLKGFILGEPSPTVLRIKGSISHDTEDIIRIKGVIKQDYNSSTLRIKGTIFNQVSIIRIKGKILRDYDNTPLRIKGTLLPVFDKPVLRIKGKIICGVEHYIRIKGKIHGIISTIRIKGNIYYGVDATSLRIKGSIGTPSAASALRIKGVIRCDGTQTALRIKGEIGKKRPIEFDKQDSWFVKDNTERFDKKDWPFETRER